ncbi:hypothetical protein AB2B38_001490 [Balneola sp. MJW-20]|uniref:hypothetical protein n=1 Tax=Gracilimonas aurantiaca TaxID=3234185 RepID=UPI00346515C4
MGQQQLLLAILVTIIVGIATVVAINTMIDARDENYSDQIKNELIEATSLARAYYQRASMLGGGGKSFANIELVHLNLSQNHTLGLFEITNRNQDNFEITVTPSFGGDIIVATITSSEITIDEE